ncbi:MAG: phenylacetate--CoA ligase family protein [Verrucomicrobiaceae bacterium]|nr:phenylacetate--CoA ligase family protein [Verrucomicrobiaceae bacterium]
MQALEDRLYPLKSLYEAAPQMLKSVFGSVYRCLPRGIRYGPAYERFYNEASEALTWTSSQIEAYQLRALNETLTAALKTPLYRRRFSGLRLPIQSPAELEGLPCLTKQDLLAHREEMVNQDLLASHGLFMTTGGSTGIPVGFYLQRGVSRPKEQAYLDQIWARGSYRPGDRVSVLRGAPTSSKATGRISWHDSTRNWQILSSYHLTLDRIPEYVSELNKFRPSHILAYPSSLLMLARAVEQLGLELTFKPKSLLCGSEVLTSHDQQWLEEYFSAPVVHWYGHSERAVLASQLDPQKSRRLYFWPTYGFVEWGEPDENGLREVIATSFHNEVMPLVRYRTGDYAKMPTSGLHEVEFPEVESITGRQHEFLESVSGRRVSLTALNMHDSIFEGLLAVQFFSDRPGRVECHYQAGPQWSASRLPAMDAALKRKLGDGFDLRFKAVTEVQRTATGKHKWLVTRSMEA